MTNGVVKGKDQLEQSVHQTSVPNFIAICAAVPSEMESRRKGMSNCALYIGLSYAEKKKDSNRVCSAGHIRRNGTANLIPTRHLMSNDKIFLV